MRRVYMDANATTPVAPEVLEAMLPYWSERFGNASSISMEGQSAKAAINRARSTVAQFLNCHDAEVVFNSGGTEGDNAAFFGLLRPGDHAITTAIEHSAVLEAARRAERMGVEVSYAAPESCGAVTADAIAALVRPNTRLISVMMANNETGVLQPVTEIGRIATDAGAYFHIDAVQAAGKLPIDVKRLGCHLLSISAHKLHGPKGTGALYARRGTPMEPLLVGGSHERRRRAGTENVAGIVGLARAVELATESLETDTMARVARLRDRLEAGLLALSGVGVNGEGAPRAANTTNMWIDGVEAEALVIALDLKGLAASGGSACHSGATEPSHVLLAMGLTKAHARASLRFSLLRTATEADVDWALAVVPNAIEQLRRLSPTVAGTAG